MPGDGADVAGVDVGCLRSAGSSEEKSVMSNAFGWLVHCRYRSARLTKARWRFRFRGWALQASQDGWETRNGGKLWQRRGSGGRGTCEQCRTDFGHLFLEACMLAVHL